MKIREMDIYFTVPVDRTALKACRMAAGYATVVEFQEELDRIGVTIRYRYIENQVKDAQGSPKRIRGDVAEFIAGVLCVPPDAAFPAYSASKTTAEQNAADNYYKPFTTIEGRNAAIIAAMENVRKAALKHCRLLKNQNGCHYMEQEDIVSLAYLSLVDAANRAMKKGIKKDVCFEAAACVTVKNDFLRMNKDNRRPSRKAEVFSLDADTADKGGNDWYDYRGITCSPEDYIILQDEVRRAVQSLTAAQKKDKRIRELLEDAGYDL